MSEEMRTEVKETREGKNEEMNLRTVLKRKRESERIKKRGREMKKEREGEKEERME